jgi:hypothetical protein
VIVWPTGKKFAFTIIDDTDFSTVANTKCVYDFLENLGFRTTKTVWPLAACCKGTTGGHSLERVDYRDWIVGLSHSGVEIALHGIADGSSERERIARGLDRFHDIIGCNPNVHVNHVGQREAIYWGPARLDSPLSWFYDRYRRMRDSRTYSGHTDGSRYFWGDLCLRRVKYVRNLVFSDINTLKTDPLMPYHDPRRPYVRYWFSASYGATVEDFCRLLSEPNQDSLMDEGGACILYTHLGDHFLPLRDEFKGLLRRLSRMPGWFVPVTTLLDYVGRTRGWRDVMDFPLEFQKMQSIWMIQQVARKFRSSGPGSRVGSDGGSSAFGHILRSFDSI